MRLIIAWAVALILLSGPARAAENNLIDGSCDAASHTAEGKMGEDLTAKQSRFYCDSAIVTFFNKKRDHVMVTFSEKKSHREGPIAFAGRLHSDGIMMDVDKVYFTPGVATPISDGWCKFFFKGPDIASIFCGAKVDDDGRRTTAVITFYPSSSPPNPTENSATAVPVDNAPPPKEDDAAAQKSDVYTGNPSLSDLKTCFAENPITISKEEADAMAAKNDFSFMNPPSICQKRMNNFVNDCVSMGHKKEDCQAGYAMLWLAINSHKN